MKKAIEIRPIYDSKNGVETGDLHYHVELNLYTETFELADVSYIVEELTKATAHIEYTLNKMSESRKAEQHDE